MGSMHALHPRPLKTKQIGAGILQNPLWNKGMGFDSIERDRLKLRGLLPPAVKTIEQQMERVLDHLREKGESDVRKNLYLQDLHNRNETLYHRLLGAQRGAAAPLPRAAHPPRRASRRPEQSTTSTGSPRWSTRPRSARCASSLGRSSGAAEACTSRRTTAATSPPVRRAQRPRLPRAPGCVCSRVSLPSHVHWQCATTGRTTTCTSSW